MSNLTHPKYRKDIDGLRAVAVLLVVAYHAFPKYVKGGFIGVDIFFVISGFLISTIILSNLEQKSFSFIEFYSRRIRRIFPALLVVLIVCLVIGWVYLLADEYMELGKHVAGGAGFVSNFVLLNESGYFDVSADEKPLLHLWSLGIEEQFYIIWPLLVWAAWKMRINVILVTGLLMAASFYLNVKNIHVNLIATFYSPQTRFWELLLGAALAWVFLYWKGITRDNSLFSNLRSLLGAVLIVTAAMIVTKLRYYPGILALLPTLGAVLVISAGPQAWLNRVILSNRVLVLVGLISYPLYLWHWVIISFGQIIDSEEFLHFQFRISAVVVSVVLAWLTYRWVEMPVRFGKHLRGKTLVLVVLMVMVGWAGFECFKKGGLEYRSPYKTEDYTDPNKGEGSENCLSTLFADAKVKPDKCASNSAEPEVLIIGDSHAGNYFKGMMNSQLKVAVIWNGGCYPGSVTQLCKDKEESIAQYIISNRTHIKLILLGSFFNYYFDKENPTLNEEILKSIEDGYLRFIGEFRRSNIDYGVMSDVAGLSRNVHGCFRTKAGCQVTEKREDIRKQQVNMVRIFDDLKRVNPGIKIFDPMEYMCSGKKCTSMKDGRLLYWDDNHLSDYGSQFISKYLEQWILKEYPGVKARNSRSS